jgi:hypothetical protein
MPASPVVVPVLEAALHLLYCLYCSLEAMLAQLDRLIPLTAGPANITLGIMPFGVRLRTEPMNRVILYDETTVVVETQVGETTHHGEQATAYAQALDHLQAEARTGEQARALITQAMSRLRTNTPGPT